MKKNKAFTLAEIIVVLTLLGTVAAITIPNTLNNSSNKSNIVKIKKAISTFDKFIETVKVTENLTRVYSKDNPNDTSTLFGFINQNDNCSKGKEYFKIKKNLEGTCQFQTYDGLWWNVSDIRKTVIATDDSCKDSISLPIVKSDPCYNKVFFLTVEDGTAEQGYAFITNKVDGDATAALIYAKIITGWEHCTDTQCKRINRAYEQECTCSTVDRKNAVSGGYSTACKACSTKYTYDVPTYLFGVSFVNGIDYEGVFDDNGKVIYYTACPVGKTTGCYTQTKNDDGTTELWNCDNGFKKCANKLKYDKFNNQLENKYYKADGSFNYKDIYVRDEDGNLLKSCSSTDENAETCD